MCYLLLIVQLLIDLQCIGITLMCHCLSHSLITHSVICTSVCHQKWFVPIELFCVDQSLATFFSPVFRLFLLLVFFFIGYFVLLLFKFVFSKLHNLFCLHCIAKCLLLLLVSKFYLSTKNVFLMISTINESIVVVVVVVFLCGSFDSLFRFLTVPHSFCLLSFDNLLSVFYCFCSNSGRDVKRLFIIKKIMRALMSQILHI